MPQHSHTREDYIALGKTVDLELIGDAPKSVKSPTTWKCMHCGKLHSKSYRSLKIRPNGCTCQNGQTLRIADYEALAKRLGIRFYASKQPKNSKDITQWQNVKTGQIVEAAYKDLAYDFIRFDLRKALGI